MKKWEYKLSWFRKDKDETPKSDLFINHLNELGVQGWRVISANLQELDCSPDQNNPLRCPSLAVNFFALMEREIPEPPDKKLEPEVIVERRVIREDGKMRIESPEE